MSNYFNQVAPAESTSEVRSWKQQIGFTGEQQVVDYLMAHGATILERNYRARGSEIDIIARKGSVVAIVEVKSRTNTHFNLSEIVTYKKQRAIIRGACQYVAKRRLHDCVVRFDIAIVEAAKPTAQQITYIPNAFQADMVW